MKLSSKPVRTSPWETTTVFTVCSGFLIFKFEHEFEHVYNCVAVSTSDNDHVKASGKEVNI